MKYVITLDLDGTLLEDDKTISDKTLKILTKLKNEGHKIVIATGRPIHGAIKYHKDLNLDTPLITDNGSLISNPSDENFKDIRKTIPLKTFRHMYKNIRPYLTTATTNKDHIVYALNYNAEVELVFNGFPAKTSYEMDLMDLDFDPMNLAVLVKSKYRKEFESYFEGRDVAARYWGEHEDEMFYDIHLKTTSKAKAVEEVLEMYNLTKDNLITIGDGPNDIEMLALSKHGTAMINASKEIKQHAGYVTEFDNNNNGVAIHLKSFFKL